MSRFRRWPWHRCPPRRSCGGDRPCSRLPPFLGRALGRLQEPSTASPAAWAAAGAAMRPLHDAPLPPRPGPSLDELASRLADECDWLVANDVLPVDVVTRNRRLAETVLRPWTPVFIHGDLQITHVFVDGDEVTGIIDWSEASQGDGALRPRHAHARTRGTPRRRHRRLRRRRRPRPDPRVVVVSKPDRDQVAGRERLRLARDVPRGRRPAITAVAAQAMGQTVRPQLELELTARRTTRWGSDPTGAFLDYLSRPAPAQGREAVAGGGLLMGQGPGSGQAVVPSTEPLDVSRLRHGTEPSRFAIAAVASGLVLGVAMFVSLSVVGLLATLGIGMILAALMASDLDPCSACAGAPAGCVGQSVGAKICPSSRVRWRLSGPGLASASASTSTSLPSRPCH